MTLKYWLLVGTATATAGLSIACSSEFDSCEARRNCHAAGGAAHSGGDGGAAGESKGGGGRASATAGKGGSGGGETAGAVGEGGELDGDSDGGEGGAGSIDPVLFGECSVKGAFACVEHASPQRLVCDGKQWQEGTTCSAGQLCDSRSGSCAPIISECSSAMPGSTVCRGDSPLTCGADLVTASEREMCAGKCKLGICQLPTCGDGKVESGEACDDAAATVPGSCLDCKKGTCGDGVVFVGTEQCDDHNLVSGDGCSATCQAEPEDLALGFDLTCVRSSTGVVKCWGNNDEGQLGQDNTASVGDDAARPVNQLQPINLGPGRTARSISARGSTVCALLDNNDLKCWGKNDAGQLGTGDTDSRGDVPGDMAKLAAIDLGSGLKAAAVNVAEGHTCAVLVGGGLKCWGSTPYGQLGQDSTDPTLLSPANIPAIKLTHVASVTGYNLTFKLSGGYVGSTCAALDDGTLRCWGWTGLVPYTDDLDIDASLGIGDFPGEMQKLPVLKPGGGGRVISVFAGDVSAALLDDGTLRLWGSGSQLAEPGPVGATPGEIANLPAVRLHGNKVKSFALGASHACAVLDEGILNCWGYAEDGQLGIGEGVKPDPVPINVPLVELGQRAKKVAAGWRHTCAILANGKVKCWGNNDHGQLGYGDKAKRFVPPDQPVELSF